MFKKIFKYQHWTILILIALLCFIYFYLENDTALLKGYLWGIRTLHWFVLAILSPIIHQFYVLVCWRSELHFNSISKLLGERGFKLYKIGFATLILSRPITIILLAFSNTMTLNINPYFSYALSIVLLIPSSYLFYSVIRYFGMNRAFGADHFYPEKFKNASFIKQGIFKYTENGMYIYGFLILWIPGILLQSRAALLAALFNHIFIWAHHYFTEVPDIKIIYKGK